MPRVKMTPTRARWFGRLGAHVLRIAGGTWRVRFHGRMLDMDGYDHLVAFLHGDMLVPAVAWRRTRGAIMISQHGDGEVIAQVVTRLGKHVPVRGSSTRGGARAFLEIVKDRAEMGWAITPDGPRGARGTVHDGVIMLASESGRPITPAGFEAASSWRLRSWDRFMIPKPFTRIAGYLGQPLHVPRDVDREARREYARELEARMTMAHDEAARALANW